MNATNPPPLSPVFGQLYSKSELLDLSIGIQVRRDQKGFCHKGYAPYSRYACTPFNGLTKWYRTPAKALAALYSL